MGPKEHMAAIGRKHENIWNRVDALREAKGKENPDWPAWCFLPFEYWYKALSREGEYTIDNNSEIYELAAIGTWRYGQGLYRFDPTLYDALSRTMPASDIVMEVFYRLPEWCIYVETPYSTGHEKPLLGFWAHLDYNTTNNHHYLCLVINTETGLMPITLKIDDLTIEEALSDMMREAAYSPLAASLTTVLHQLLSLLLYICQDTPDIESLSKPGSHPERPRPTRTKAGWRLYAPTNPRTWSIGRQAGLELERDEWAQTPLGTAYIIPTLIKKASWKGGWKETEEGKKRYEYRWISPKAVNK